VSSIVKSKWWKSSLKKIQSSVSGFKFAMKLYTMVLLVCTVFILMAPFFLISFEIISLMMIGRTSSLCPSASLGMLLALASYFFKASSSAYSWFVFAAADTEPPWLPKVTTGIMSLNLMSSVKPSNSFLYCLSTPLSSDFRRQSKAIFYNLLSLVFNNLSMSFWKSASLGIFLRFSAF